MFVNVASRLNVNSTQDVVNEKLRYFITSRLTTDVEPFNIPQITEKDILESKNKLPTNKSTGDDGLSARVLKLIAPALRTPLVKMMNISIDNSVFPNEWKIALVAPLHKDGPRDDVNNYRPIAVLPVLSKILERHVTKSLTNYLNENNLIFKYQSAFRENHSTETALIKLTDELLFNMDNDKVISWDDFNRLQKGI